MNPAFHHRPLLGTFVEISISDKTLPSHVTEDLAEIAFGRMARVQALMNFHDPASEMSRLNACGHLHPLTIHPWTREVLKEAVRISRSSEGVFDITTKPSANALTFLPHPHLQSDRDENAPSHRDIVFHHDGRVSFKKALRIDLSRVARGFAIDKASEILSEAGLASAIIKAGGDYRFIGKRPSQFTISDSTENSNIIPLKSAAVSTTSAYLANHLHHWKKSHHILHPKTQKPMRSNVSLSVFAHSCLQAEALSNVILLDEPESWQRLLLKERAYAVLVTSKGEAVKFPHRFAA